VDCNDDTIHPQETGDIYLPASLYNDGAWWNGTRATFALFLRSYLACPSQVAANPKQMITVGEVLLGVFGGSIIVALLYSVGYRFFVLKRRGLDILPFIPDRRRSQNGDQEYDSLPSEVDPDLPTTDTLD
jgi:hypothetical protein